MRLTPEELHFWDKVFLSEICISSSLRAASTADSAVKERRKRAPLPQKEDGSAYR